MRERVLEAAEALVLRQGIRATTLDQVVERLGISKKTLYDFFPSKEALIEAAMERFLNRIQAQVADLRTAHQQDPLLAIVATANFAYRTLSAINPTLFREITRLEPALQDKLYGRIRELIQQNLHATLQEGLQQGLFRSDLDMEFIPLWMFYVLTSAILNPDIAQAIERPISEVYAESMLLFLYSFTTEAGRARLVQYQAFIRETYVRSA